MPAPICWTPALPSSTRNLRDSLGSGPQTFGSLTGSNSSYEDVWTTTASSGTANPITYSFHYLVYANDPTIYCYEVLNHAATDPATNVGQGQFLFRSNPSLFTNLYQVNTGANQLGTSNAVTTLNVASTYANWSTIAPRRGEPSRMPPRT